MFCCAAFVLYFGGLLWEQKKNIICLGAKNMENTLKTICLNLNNASMSAEAKEVVKDAIGAFAIFVMLYVGLFIPTF